MKRICACVTSQVPAAAERCGEVVYKKEKIKIKIKIKIKRICACVNQSSPCSRLCERKRERKKTACVREVRAAAARCGRVKYEKRKRKRKEKEKRKMSACVKSPRQPHVVGKLSIKKKEKRKKKKEKRKIRKIRRKKKKEKEK